MMRTRSLLLFLVLTAVAASAARARTRNTRRNTGHRAPKTAGPTSRGCGTSIRPCRCNVPPPRRQDGHHQGGIRGPTHLHPERAGRTQEARPGGSHRSRLDGRHAAHRGPAHVAHHLPRKRPAAGDGRRRQADAAVDDVIALLAESKSTAPPPHCWRCSPRSPAARKTPTPTSCRPSVVCSKRTCRRCRRSTTTTSRSSSPRIPWCWSRTFCDASSPSTASRSRPTRSGRGRARPADTGRATRWWSKPGTSTTARRALPVRAPRAARS